MIILSVSGLSFHVGAKEIIGGVSFSVEDGDKLGIVGVNGSGKSTLLNMICKKTEPTEGNIYTAKERTVGMMEQNEAFSDADSDGGTLLERMYAAYPELCRDEARLSKLETLLENAKGEDVPTLAAELSRVNARYVENGGLHYKSRCRSILLRLGFTPDSFEKPISDFSGGERARIGLARLLLWEPDILILDEPTNHLDTDAMEWLEEHLASYKKTLIVVSHDRYFLDRVTNKTLEIENGRAKLYNAPYSGFVKQKAAERAAAEKKYDLQQKEIARLEAYIENQRRLNRERNIIAAESREKAIARMDKVEKPKEAPRAIRFSFKSDVESGNDVLSVRKLSAGYGSNVLFSDVSFEVKKRERLFIAGANGVGKSTLLKVLLGKAAPLGGFFEFGANVKTGYYDQENQALDLSKTVIDELWDAHPNVNETALRNILASFMFRGEDAFKQVYVLSGGERARLTLAKLIMSGMNLLILDEPTNHLDIQSREALENALENFDGTVIAVSHDRYFMKKIATRVIEIYEKSAVDYRWGYDEYLEAREKRKREKSERDERGKEDIRRDTPEGDAVTGKELFLRRKKESAEARQAEKRRRDVMRETKELEEELERVSNELYGEAASDYVRAAELDKRKNEIEERLLTLYEEQESFRDL